MCIRDSDMNASEHLNTVPLHSNDLFLARFTPCPQDASAAISLNTGVLNLTFQNIPYIDSVAWFFEGEIVGIGTTWIPELYGLYSAEIFFDGCSIISEEFEIENIEVGNISDNRVRSFILSIA